MGTRQGPQEYSRHIVGVYLPGSLYSFLFLLFSWGFLFGVPSKVPLFIVLPHPGEVCRTGWVGAWWFLICCGNVRGLRSVCSDVLGMMKVTRKAENVYRVALFIRKRCWQVGEGSRVNTYMSWEDGELQFQEVRLRIVFCITLSGKCSGVNL